MYIGATGYFFVELSRRHAFVENKAEGIRYKWRDLWSSCWVSDFFILNNTCIFIQNLYLKAPNIF